MIETKNLVKNYYNGDVVTEVLRGIDLKIKKGEFVAVMGRSGAGKSTLLYQMSLLDHPTSGEVVIDGINTETLSHEERTAFRLHRLGYVFQDYALLPELSAVENVMLPQLMQGVRYDIAFKKSRDALERVGLKDRINNAPSQLSGGEQQRASIARCIAHDPDIIFADEPTANLDSYSSGRVMEIFKALHKGGQTIIMVTHEEEYGLLAEKIIEIRDGKIVALPA